MRSGLLAGLFCLGSVGAWSAPQEQVIDVRALRPASGNSFEALFAAYRRADASGESETRRKILEEIGRFRVERNVRSLEDVALALVARGVERLGKGEPSRAEEEFQRAVELDPHLPDGHFGLARADLKRGPLGIVPALRHMLAGMTSRLDSSKGEYHLLRLVVVVGLVALLAATLVLALTLLLRHGSLLLHDVEEAFGGARGRTAALALYGALLLLPALAFQGWAWLPLWWLALLFIYASRSEQALVVLTLVTATAAGPVIAVLESRALAARNPLFRASMLSVEGGPDRRAISQLEGAVRQYPDDRDLAYLLAQQYKKADAYDDAAAVYRDVLRKRDRDAIALNNLANLEFAQAEYPAAITRYKLASESSESISTEILATIYYNLSLAYLQRFERQPADEARGQADRLAAGLTRTYDRLWKYEARNENAVVDLGLDRAQVWAKFSGAPEGVALQNVSDARVLPGYVGRLAPAAFNRLTGFLAIFALAVFLVSRWRGARTFTMSCQKCGTPFCKRCHLGAAPAGLCTQCYHLFVVRDGVSGPARNQKLLEVQKEDERRERVFRALSLVSPGAGHLYAQKTFVGAALVLLWYVLLCLTLLGGRLLPVTETPAVLAGQWMLAAGVLALLATYFLANRARPEFEAALPIPRGPRRRTA